jgi:hypothetical protein
MGRLTYLLIGIIVGVGAGIVGMQIWTNPHFGSTVPAVSAQESYFLCKSEYSKGDIPLIIKGDASGAKSMVYSGKTDTDVFTIEKVADLHYIAQNSNAEAAEAYTTLRFNRLTGELISQSRLPSEALKLLVSICEKRIDDKECRTRIERIKGASMWDCLNSLESSCPRLISSGLPAALRYQCRKVEARF